MASRALYRFSILTSIASFLLIVAGGLVTSTGSGLSVPDWPLSYGRFFPPMVGGVRFEHSHRMIAGMVGMMTVLLAFFVWKKEPRLRVKRLALCAVLAVILQALLGGMTVLFGLPAAVSVAHALLGPTFFALIVLLSATLSAGWPRRQEGRGTFFRWALLATTGLYGQLFLGAILRHTGHGLSVHIAGAVGVTVLLLVLAKEAWHHPWAKLLPGFILLQLILGGVTFLTGNGVLVATAHVAVGAWLLATCITLTASSWPRRGTSSPFRGLSIYFELTKPRLTALAMASSLCGFLLASGGTFSVSRLFLTLVGTALVGGGAGALNQVMERKEDALMKRTKNRPIPSGRISETSALSFGVAAASIGVMLLTFAVHPVSGLLAAVTLISYLFLYTPLKRKTHLCTLVGAIPGAMPPLIGWAAHRGGLNLEAWILFAILFLWQLPHFLAIAWTHRDDYAKAGFQMLPVVDPDGGATGRQIALYTAALVPVSIFPAGLGLAGLPYVAAALVASLAFFRLGWAVFRSPSPILAHRLFVGSIIYLPWILTTMTLDRLIR